MLNYILYSATNRNFRTPTIWPTSRSVLTFDSGNSTSWSLFNIPSSVIVGRLTIDSLLFIFLSYFFPFTGNQSKEVTIQYGCPAVLQYTLAEKTIDFSHTEVNIYRLFRTSFNTSPPSMAGLVFVTSFILDFVSVNYVTVRTQLRRTSCLKTHER